MTPVFPGIRLAKHRLATTLTGGPRGAFLPGQTTNAYTTNTSYRITTGMFTVGEYNVRIRARYDDGDGPWSGSVTFSNAPIEFPTATPTPTPRVTHTPTPTPLVTHTPTATPDADTHSPAPRAGADYRGGWKLCGGQLDSRARRFDLPAVCEGQVCWRVLEDWRRQS